MTSSICCLSSRQPAQHIKVFNDEYSGYTVTLNRVSLYRGLTKWEFTTSLLDYSETTLFDWYAVSYPQLKASYWWGFLVWFSYFCNWQSLYCDLPNVRFLLSWSQALVSSWTAGHDNGGQGVALDIKPPHLSVIVMYPNSHLASLDISVTEFSTFWNNTLLTYNYIMQFETTESPLGAFRLR